MWAELLILLAVIVMVYVLFRVVKNVIYLIINSILGLLTLFVANLLVPGLDITYTWLVILICAIGGIIGAVIIIILQLLTGMF